MWRTLFQPVRSLLLLEPNCDHKVNLVSLRIRMQQAGELIRVPHVKWPGGPRPFWWASLSAKILQYEGAWTPCHSPWPHTPKAWAESQIHPMPNSQICSQMFKVQAWGLGKEKAHMMSHGKCEANHLPCHRLYRKAQEGKRLQNLVSHRVELLGAPSRVSSSSWEAMANSKQLDKTIVAPSQLGLRTGKTQTNCKQLCIKMSLSCKNQWTMSYVWSTSSKNATIKYNMANWHPHSDKSGEPPQSRTWECHSMFFPQICCTVVATVLTTPENAMENPTFSSSPSRQEKHD